MGCSGFLFCPNGFLNGFFPSLKSFLPASLPPVRGFLSPSLPGVEAGRFLVPGFMSPIVARVVPGGGAGSFLARPPKALRQPRCYGGPTNLPPQFLPSSTLSVLIRLPMTPALTAPLRVLCTGGPFPLPLRAARSAPAAAARAPRLCFSGALSNPLRSTATRGATRSRDPTPCRAMADSAVAPAVIIGGGRVGRALEAMGSGDDVVVKRGEPIPAGSTGPIFVCTRNDSLQGIVDACPPERREDLVFLQNGMLDPWLQSIGLGAATQVLVYFAVAKLGEAPTDGITNMNPEGLTAATGKWAEAAAARFKAGGLSCKVLDKASFDPSMYEKLIWICAFMLVGARHPGATVGDVEAKHTGEVTQLINELAAAATAEAGVEFGPQLAERLCAYARSVAHFPTAVKELEWRNGFFHSLSTKAEAAGKPDPCPTHTAWLKEVGAI
mmetsp:Transcript_24935/g.78971  ORF Transcript_24935/g.78971 Transcript_24935/m.78971 type:complete len:440 (-) Transcript_24935:367-1686(-)